MDKKRQKNGGCGRGNAAVASLVVCLLLPVSALASRDDAPEPLNLPNITVLADTSLTLPLNDIARAYAKNSGVMVSATYASGKEHSSAIEEGQEADVYITSRPEWINTLKLQGLVDVYSQKRLVGNRLVMIADARDRVKFILNKENNPAELLEGKEPDAFFALGDPTSVAQGAFGAEALKAMGSYSALEPFMVFLKDDYQVMNTVTRFKGYGITYKTEAKQNPAVRIVDSFPQEFYAPVYYEAIVVAGENMATARKFVEYLASKEAKAVFRKYGFKD